MTSVTQLYGWPFSLKRPCDRFSARAVNRTAGLRAFDNLERHVFVTNNAPWRVRDCVKTKNCGTRSINNCLAQGHSWIRS